MPGRRTQRGHSQESIYSNETPEIGAFVLGHRGMTVIRPSRDCVGAHITCVSNDTVVSDQHMAPGSEKGASARSME